MLRTTLPPQLIKAIVGPLWMTLHEPQGSNQPLWKDLWSLAVMLESASPHVKLKSVSSEESQVVPPALSLGAVEESQRFHYRAYPNGPELKPFIELIEALCGKRRPSRAWHRYLEALVNPASLSVLISPHCPTCPVAVSVAHEVALVSERVSVTVVDITKDKALAERLKIKSVPVTLLEDGNTLDGVLPAKEIAYTISRRGSDDYERERFRSIVRNGRHQDAAGLLVSDGAKHFLDWWGESTLTERIWLMLVAEESLKNDRKSLDHMITDLQRILKTDNVSLRGDTVDLLGRIGHPAARSAIVELCHDSNSHVAEVAREALRDLDSANRAN